MTKTSEQLAIVLEDKLEKSIAREGALREHLKTAVTRIENLYRLIYGHVNNGETLTAKHEYIAERYCIDTIKLLADENGDTGLQCRSCGGLGNSFADNAECCDVCAGTGTVHISPDA